MNELIARLTGQPVRDNTQTNRPTDSSPETFPLNCTFYADSPHVSRLWNHPRLFGIGPFPETPPTGPENRPEKSESTQNLGRFEDESLQCKDGCREAQVLGSPGPSIAERDLRQDSRKRRYTKSKAIHAHDER